MHTIMCLQCMFVVVHDLYTLCGYGSESQAQVAVTIPEP